MNLFDLSARLTLDSAQFDKAVGKASKTGNSLAKNITAKTIAFGTMIGNFATKSMSRINNYTTGIFKSAYSAFADFEQLEGGIATLFKKDLDPAAFEYVMARANDAYMNAGVSANKYMESVTAFSASLLQSTGGNTLEAATVADMAMQDMSDNANKMGTNLESIQNAYQGFAKQNYTMLDNLKLGYGGTKSEMERLLADAGKITGKKYDLNNLADVFEAIHAIQEQQGITGTTAEEAATTVAGSTNMMKASWENLLISIGRGKDIKQASKNFVKSFTTMMKNAIPAAGKALKGIFEGLKEFDFGDVFKTAKIEIAKLIGVGNPEDASWKDIASKIYNNIKTGIQNKVGTAKVKLANWLGLTDDSGNAVDDPSDTSWFSIAGGIFEKIKTGFATKRGEAKVKLAQWLGLTDENGNPVDDADDTSWSAIAQGIKEKLQTELKTAKTSIAEFLGISAEDIEGETSWGDIGKKILEKITEKISSKGNFLKRLILGEDFTDKSTWTDVADKITGWMTEAFADGGILNTILGEGTDRLTAIISFAGDLLTGIATWISQNAPAFTTMLTTLITSLADALSKAAGPITTALIQILSNPQLWEAIVNGLGSIGEALSDAIFGKDVTNAIKRFLNIDIPGEISDINVDNIGASWVGLMNELFEDPSQEGQLAAKWNDFMARIFNDSKIDPLKYNDFMDQFGYDNMKSAFSSMSLSDFYSSLNESLKSIKDGSDKIKELKGQATDTAGEYRIHFNIETDGEMPDVSRTDRDDGFHNAKGNWNVPYDDFHARLHRGEMVLTKSQARQYKYGQSGGVNYGAIGRMIHDELKGINVYLGAEKAGDVVSKRVNRNITASRNIVLKGMGG